MAYCDSMKDSAHATLRAIGWLVAGLVGYLIVTAVIETKVKAALPEGGLLDLGIPAGVFILLEVAALFVVAAVLCALAALTSALILRRGVALSPDLPVKFAYLGARLLVASWPFHVAYLVVRGGYVPGSPAIAVVALVAAGLAVCEGGALWQVWRARRDVPMDDAVLD